MGFQCGAPAANQNAIPVMISVGTRQRQGTLGKGKLRSPVGGTIYANLIWPGMKWKYASRNAQIQSWQASVYTTMLLSE